MKTYEYCHVERAITEQIAKVGDRVEWKPSRMRAQKCGARLSGWNRTVGVCPSCLRGWWVNGNSPTHDGELWIKLAREAWESMEKLRKER